MKPKTLHPIIFKRLLAQIPVPDRFAGSTFDNFDIAGHDMAAVLEAAQTFAQNLPDHLNTGRSMLMFGTPGTGKTHLALAAAKVAAQRGFTARYITAAALARVARLERQMGHLMPMGSELDAFAEPDLLVVDNVNWPDDPDLHQFALQTVICERYAQRLPMIVITSLNKMAFADLLGPMAFDRITERGNLLLKMQWASYRSAVAHEQDQPHDESAADQEGPAQ